MLKNQNVLIKCCFPRWFIFFITISSLILLLFCISYIVIVTHYDFISSGILKIVFFIVILLVGIWLSILLFYTVTATEEGLETANPILKSKKSCTWGEIIEVRKPRLGIPVAFRYVVLKSNKKILLIRDFLNYKEVIELIKLRAPNLKKIGKGI